MLPLDQLRFGKQFFITRSTISQSEFRVWKSVGLDNQYCLYYHPELNIASVTTQSVKIIGLGHFLDPTRTQASDSEILSDLGQAAVGFAELENALARLGGRWALIATLGRATRIYHDAGGLKPVFYCGKAEQGMSVASQPALLAAIGITEPDYELRQQYEACAPQVSWPIYAIPYQGVTQLLPNHTLDVQTGKSIRYWPKEPIQSHPVDVLANSMANMLSSIIKAATYRRRCVMSLTGGYDTRLLLACAYNCLDEIDFFTIKSPYTPYYDLEIPRKIAKKKNLQYVIIEEETDDAYVDILGGNVGDMYHDPSISKAKSFAVYVGDRFHLTGMTSELNRCYYYKNGMHPAALTADVLSRRARFDDNPIARRGIAKWLDEAPSHFNINLLDLFYWEHRLGVWGSCGLTFREAIIDQIPPMNCREFIQLGLSSEVGDRRKPYELIRSIIRQTDPQLLNYLFNYSWRDALAQTCRIPQRVVKRVKRKVLHRR